MADLLATVTGGLLAIAGGFVAKYFADRREEMSINLRLPANFAL